MVSWLHLCGAHDGKATVPRYGGSHQISKVRGAGTSVELGVPWQFELDVHGSLPLCLPDQGMEVVFQVNSNVSWGSKLHVRFHPHVVAT